MSRPPIHPARRRGRRGASALAMVVALAVLPLSGASADEARTEASVPRAGPASPVLDATWSTRVEVHDVSRGRRAGLRAPGRRIGRAELDRSSILQLLSRRARSRVRLEGLRPTVRSDRVLRPPIGTRERSSAAVTRRALRAARSAFRSIGATLRRARSGTLSSHSTTQPPPTGS